MMAPSYLLPHLSFLTLLLSPSEFVYVSVARLKRPLHVLIAPCCCGLTA